MTYKQMINQLEKRRASLGKERDKLHTLLSETEDLLDSLELADENLQSAISVLSQFV